MSFWDFATFIGHSWSLMFRLLLINLGNMIMSQGFALALYVMLAAFAVVCSETCRNSTEKWNKALFSMGTNLSIFACTIIFIFQFVR